MNKLTASPFSIHTSMKIILTIARHRNNDLENTVNSSLRSICRNFCQYRQIFRYQRWFWRDITNQPIGKPAHPVPKGRRQPIARPLWKAAGLLTLNVANHQGAVVFDLVSHTRRDIDIVLVPREYGWSRSSFGVAFQSSFTFLKQVKWTKSILLKRWCNG